MRTRRRHRHKKEVNPEDQESATERRAERPANGGASDGEAPEGTRRRAAGADEMRAFGALGSVGLAFVLSIVIGVAGGLLIDRWLGTSPLGFFVGFFLGVAAGILTVVRASRSIR